VWPSIWLAQEYLGTKQPALAQTYLLEAYSIMPDDPNVLNELGCLYLMKKEYEKAKNVFVRALAGVVGEGLRDSIVGNFALVRLKIINSGVDAEVVRKEVEETLELFLQNISLKETRSVVCLKMWAIFVEIQVRLGSEMPKWIDMGLSMLERILELDRENVYALEAFQRLISFKISLKAPPGTPCKRSTNCDLMMVESSPNNANDSSSLLVSSNSATPNVPSASSRSDGSRYSLRRKMMTQLTFDK